LRRQERPKCGEQANRMIKKPERLSETGPRIAQTWRTRVTAKPSGRPWSRLAAWLIDWLLVLEWVAILAAVGIPLFLNGVTSQLSVVTLNLIATLALVVPVTIGLAVLESGDRGATVGKRVRRLEVVTATTGTPASMKRTLLRNVLKIAVPWTIGHAAVYGIVTTDAAAAPAPSVWILTAIAYVLPLVYVVSLFVGSGRTPYDRISGTTVRVAAVDPDAEASAAER